MLSPSNSQSRSIRRSKSSTSVKERQKHPIASAPQDPESARVHALIAAHRAMDRSRTSTSEDLNRSDSLKSKKSAMFARTRHTDDATPAAQLRHQRSILQATTPSLATSLAHPVGSTTGKHGPPSFTHASISEFGSAFDGERSSYRRLRKVRQEKTLRHTTSTTALQPLKLKVRLRRSVDALRLARRRATSPGKPSNSQSYRPESVEIARAQFLQEASSPHFPESAMSIETRTNKEFRSSVRSEKSPETKSTLHNRNTALRVARSISSSLRSRFKQAFTKPTFGLPPQQLDASRAHFGDNVFVNDGNGGFDDYHVYSPGEKQDQSYYDPPWHEHGEGGDSKRLSTIIPVNMSDTSLAGSSKSRVTSWTNTTISESNQETLIERKRLSVIQEDGGPHQPSNSAGTHIGGVTVSRKPLPSQCVRGPDPQRLYSALIRRMNQESADQAKPPLADVQEHDEEQLASVQTTDGTKDHATIWQTETPMISSDYKVFNNNWHDTQFKQPDSRLVMTVSQESIYSQSTNGLGESCRNEPSGVGALSGSDIDMVSHRCTAPPHLWIDKSNPYLASDVWASSQLQTTQLRDSSSHISDTAPHVQGSSDQCRNLKGMVDREPATASSHIRESAHVQTDQNTAEARRRDLQSYSKRKGWIYAAERGPESNSTSTPSPPFRVLDQLSVTKRRFPLLDVREVSDKEVPSLHHPKTLTRSQSGLLQGDADAKEDNAQPVLEHEQPNRITSSFRKFTPENIGNLLRGKKSIAVLRRQSNDKENRPNSARTDVALPEKEEAASTPGPTYLAMRSGNSGSNKPEKSPVLKEESPLRDESPTGLVRGTLSARLSRPFNMDTPEDNRPFDSMYLGKRELGFHDTSGGRLSVAAKQNVHGYNKQRSFDRGPGSYGGLGPSPFESPGKNEAETALPHMPTPEDRAKRKTRSGLSQGSRRMVSNFLRSRRREGSSGTTVPNHINQRHTAIKANEEAPTSSPLFI